jgi:hypothetical protein
MRTWMTIGMGLLVLGSTGCEIRKAMYDQPKYKTHQQSDFFGDDRIGRPWWPARWLRGI